MLKECYYFDQTNWKSEDYYTLHLFLTKMIENYDTTVGSYDGNKRIEEIKALDLSRMTEESKVLLYCIIQNEKKQLQHEEESIIFQFTDSMELSIDYEFESITE